MASAQTDRDLRDMNAVLQALRAETVRPTLPFRLEEGDAGLFGSKVGGTPYLPREEAWPLDGAGNPMFFLAQVDCTELQKLPDFPHQGLLQFFHGADDVFGADFDDLTAQTGFRVFWWPETDPGVREADVLAKKPDLEAPEGEAEYYSPLCHLDSTYRIVFEELQMQEISGCDCRFEPLFVEKWNQRRPDAPLNDLSDFFKRFPEGQKPFFILDPAVGEEEEEEEEKPQHRMGGYPWFTQSDPRGENRDYEGLDTLLFQLDSDYQDEEDIVLWGDMGVGNFFIGTDALKQKDFSRVLYSWDCC